MAARTPHAKNHGDLAASASRYVKVDDLPETGFLVASVFADADAPSFLFFVSPNSGFMRHLGLSMRILARASKLSPFLRTLIHPRRERLKNTPRSWPNGWCAA